jgi:hypothetical protein
MAGFGKCSAGVWAAAGMLWFLLVLTQLSSVVNVAADR